MPTTIQAAPSEAQWLIDNQPVSKSAGKYSDEDAKKMFWGTNITATRNNHNLTEIAHKNTKSTLCESIRKLFNRFVSIFTHSQPNVATKYQTHEMPEAMRVIFYDAQKSSVAATSKNLFDFLQTENCLTAHNLHHLVNGPTSNNPRNVFISEGENAPLPEHEPAKDFLRTYTTKLQGIMQCSTDEREKSAIRAIMDTKIGGVKFVSWADVTLTNLSHNQKLHNPADAEAIRQEMITLLASVQQCDYNFSEWQNPFANSTLGDDKLDDLLAHAVLAQREDFNNDREENATDSASISIATESTVESTVDTAQQSSQSSVKDLIRQWETGTMKPAAHG